MKKGQKKPSRSCLAAARKGFEENTQSHKVRYRRFHVM